MAKVFLVMCLAAVVASCSKKPSVAGVYKRTESMGFAAYELRPDGTASFVYENSGVSITNNNIGNVLFKGEGEGRWRLDGDRLTYQGSLTYDCYKGGEKIWDNYSTHNIKAEFKIVDNGDLAQILENNLEKSGVYVRQK